MKVNPTTVRIVLTCISGKNYFYADKYGNIMYAQILGSANGAGIYKFSLN